MSRTVVLASNNAGKVRELQALLGACDLTIVPQANYAVPEAEETGLTFIENAILKARNAAAHTGLPAIADDSGLEVDALQGAPGVRSARYAGDNANDEANLRKVLAALEGVADAKRTARFHCVLAYLRHAEDPTPLIAHGTWEGRILRSPIGENGFGYDPIFFVPSHGCASAELAPEVKNQFSHRGQALRQLQALLREHTR